MNTLGAGPLIDPSLLFEFEWSIPRARHNASSARGIGIPLPDQARVPDLSSLSGKSAFGDIRIAWSEKGIHCQVHVTGRKSIPKGEDTRFGISTGFRFWIDTRSSPDIHRATKYCHNFDFIPATNLNDKQGKGRLVPIPRFREEPNAIDANDLVVESNVHKHGPQSFSYDMRILIPASVLTGYLPSEFSEVGFFYSLIDDELGVQTLSMGSEMRYYEDPSLWVRGRLVDG